jgi:tetratricopeptide (TPR) repeat protein
LLLLLDYWPLARFELDTGRRRLKGLWPCVWEKLPFLALSAVSSIVTYRVQAASEAVAFTSELPSGLRFENAIVSYARYLGKTVWPLDLAVLYPHPEHWPFWQVGLAATLIAAITLGAIRLARQLPFLPAGWFWYLGTLVPVIGLVQVGSQSIADRYTYLPLIGVFIMFAWGASHLTTRLRLSGGVVAGVAAVILCACAAMSVRQARFWQNSGTLFSHAVAVTENNYVAYNNLGAWYMVQSQAQDALSSLQNAFQIVASHGSGRAENSSLASFGPPPSVEVVTNSGYASVLNNLGLALARAGREKESLPYFRRAVELKPKDPEYWDNFGQALLTQNQAPQAIECFQAALRIRPDFGKAHFNLANALAALGRLDDALGEYRLALRQCAEPEEVHTRFGIALAQKGSNEEAIAHFQEAVRLSPNSPLYHNNLGNALTGKGRNEEAMREFGEALRLQPDYPQAHLNLGMLLERMGRREEAVAHLKESLRLDPANAALREHLRGLGVTALD